MIRSFRYPLHPTKDQEKVLEEWLYRCRMLYNAALQERRDAWKKQKVSISKLGQQKSITEIRANDPEWKEIPARILRSATDRVDEAFKAFFRRCKSGEKPGYPRFKGRDRYNSFSFPTQEPLKITNRSKGHSATLPIPKLGSVKFNQYRPHKGKILKATIRKEASGWYVNLTCDLGASPSKVEPREVVGIDLGLKSFATLSDGSEIPNPRFFRKSEELLAQRQRSLALKKRNSQSKRRAKRLVAKTHEHVRNQRLDFARKTAKSLFAKYDVVVHEDLQIRNMVRNPHLAKSISDAAWGLLLQCLASKAEEAGKHDVGVDPRGTSQDCSGCGETVPKGLSDRTHHCPHCGLVKDRDWNAALNIKSRGLREVTGFKINLNPSEVRRVA